MRAADVACIVSQSQPQGAREGSLTVHGDVAVPSRLSAAGADRASAVKGLGSAQGSEPAGGENKVVVGYWREHSTLTHVIIRNAGHMVRLDDG